MEVYKHLCHTAKSSTLWSGWKVNNPHPMPFAFKKKGPFENDRDFSSKVKSRGVEGPIILTKEEALTFLDNTLGICRSQVHAGGKSLDFLNNVIRQMKRRVPFTNINLLAGKFADFTAADFKHHIVSGQGGTCLWINPFIKVLLEQLGHVAFHIPGINHPISDIEKRTHISTIICDISYPGSQHLVDPGMRHPLHEALPLDFDRESPTYTFHKYKIKFFKTENESLLLCTPCSAPHPETWVLSDANRKSWQVKLEYRLNEKITFPKFLRMWQNYFKRGIFFNKPFDSLLFLTSLNEKVDLSIMCTDGQIHVSNIDMENKVTERGTMTRTELMDFFLEHHPQYSVKTLQKVFEVSKLK